MLASHQDAVKLHVSFPHHLNIDQLISLLTQRYLFIQHIKKCPGNQLLISFDAMSDLLEIDFVGEFGALGARVKNSDSFCKEMNEQHLISTEDAGSSGNIESICNKRDKLESQNVPRRHQRAAQEERLTSLEDVVNQQQKILKNLVLFNDQILHSRIDVQEKKKELNLSEEQIQIGESQNNKQSIWGSVVGGIVLTSFLLGGVRVLKCFLG